MKTFDYSLVKDPQYFKDGRMDAHSDHTYYRDGEEVQEKETSFRMISTESGNSTMPVTMEVRFRNLKKQNIAAKTGMISVYLHISRWKDMMYRSMPTYSIRGKVMRTFIRVRFRSILIRLQAM